MQDSTLNRRRFLFATATTLAATTSLAAFPAPILAQAGGESEDDVSTNEDLI